MGKILESMADEDSEPKSEVVDKQESGPEAVAELVLPQEEIFSQPTEVEELPIETLLDLSAESITELVPSLIVNRASLFLTSPDVYDLLQIFLQKTTS